MLKRVRTSGELIRHLVEENQRRERLKKTIGWLPVVIGVCLILASIAYALTIVHELNSTFEGVWQAKEDSSLYFYFDGSGTYHDNVHAIPLEYSDSEKVAVCLDAFGGSFLSKRTFIP